MPTEPGPIRSHRRGFAAAAALVALTTVVVAGCSSSSSDGSGGKAKASTTTTTDGGSGGTSTTRPPIDPSSVKGGTQAYVDAMVPMIASSGGLGKADSEKAAECLAPKWVEIIGVEAFAEAGIRPEDFPKLGGGLEQLHLTKAQAEDMAKGFATCKIDVRRATVAQLTDDPSIPQDVKDCIDHALTEDMVLQGLVASLSGGQVPEELYAAPQKCVDDYQAAQGKGQSSGG